MVITRKAKACLDLVQFLQATEISNYGLFAVVDFQGLYLIHFSLWLTKSSLSGGDSPIRELGSVQFSHSVMSDSLRPHELQHARPPCPLPTPRVYSNSCPSHRWHHPAISSCVVPFSSCPQSLPASGSFPVSQLFAWGGQSIGVSASPSVLPMNTQELSPSKCR